MLSKLLLVVLLFKLASQFGLRTKLRELKPKIDRAVNITIVVVVVAYAGQLLWLIWQKHAAG
jgi:hypothetical protein